MKTVTTRNSTYEIDEGDPMRVRRVSGVNTPTPNFKSDGVWHTLSAVHRLGELDAPQYLFIFEDGTSTLTSAILEER